MLQVVAHEPSTVKVGFDQGLIGFRHYVPPAALWRAQNDFHHLPPLGLPIGHEVKGRRHISDDQCLRREVLDEGYEVRARFEIFHQNAILGGTAPFNGHDEIAAVFADLGVRKPVRVIRRGIHVLIGGLIHTQLVEHDPRCRCGLA